MQPGQGDGRGGKPHNQCKQTTSKFHCYFPDAILLARFRRLSDQWLVFTTPLDGGGDWERREGGVIIAGVSA